MIGLLAASSPPPQALHDWLGVLAFILGIGVLIKNLLSKKPSHAELATKEELSNYVRQSTFNEFKTEVRGDMKEIKAMITASTEKVEQYAEKSYGARKDIHKQVNGIDKGLTEVKTRQAEQGKQIQTLTLRDNGTT